jgi:dihydroxyacid dehydratase/phosphogluconate dehydratase
MPAAIISLEASMAFNPRHQSHILVDGADRAAARSFFKAIGFTDDDLTKPLVGVAHCWIEITPCNWKHSKLAEEVKRGIRDAGGTPIEFNTTSVTDGIAMGTEGMKASLVSREIVADLVELVAGFMIGHVAPEAADGGPIAAVKRRRRDRHRYHEAPPRR